MTVFLPKYILVATKKIKPDRVNESDDLGRANLEPKINIS